MKKALSLLLVVIMVAGLMTGAAFADDAKELVVGLSYDFGDISPFGSMSMGRSYGTYEFESIAKPQYTDGDTLDDMYWVIGESYEKIDDYTYNIKIHDNVYDSEGTPITAADCVFCYETQLAKANDETITNYLEGATLVDDYTFQIKLKDLGLNTIEYMLRQINIVSKDKYEASGNGMAINPVATGGYKLASFTAGSEAVYVKDENYWREAAGYDYPEYMERKWDKITMKVIPEAAQMTIALQDGTIDLAVFVDNSNLNNFMDADSNDLPGWVSAAIAGGPFTSLLYNCDAQSPMHDTELRKAVSYAIDCNTIVKAALDGKGGVDKAFSHPSYADWQPEWENHDYFDYNPEKAAEILKGANYNGESLVIAYETNDVKQKIAQIINAYLTNIGVNSEIVAYETALFDSYKYDPAQWDILIDQKGSANGFVTFPWQLCFAPGAFELGTCNFIQDDKLVELYNAACSVDTHSNETVKAFEQYLEDNAYVMAMYYSQQFAVANSNVVSDIMINCNAVRPWSCGVA